MVVSGHKLMEYIMVRYENINKPIKYQAKLVFREDYDPSLPISKYFKRIEDAVQIIGYDIFTWQPEQILPKTYRQMKNAASTRMNVRID